MSYQFRCPLCLKKLDAGHTLVAFRIVDSTGEEPPLSSEIDCADENFMEQLLQFGGNALYTPATERSVFVSHLQCDAANPFWKETAELDEQGDEIRMTARVDIPGSPNDGEKIIWTFNCSITGNRLKKEMQHKVISMLRTTGRYYELHRAMWFPFALLRSTAMPEGEDLRRPFGSLVEMASAPGVGKTILTLQLMNERTFSNRNNRYINSAAYFFPRRELAQNGNQESNTFMDELFFHSSWSKRPEFRPLPTTTLTPGDLRAILIKPVGAATKLTLQAKTPSAENGGYLKAVREALGYFLEEVGFKKRKAAPRTNVVKELAQPNYWHPILFYDTAGEAHLKGSEITLAVRRLTNKLAICVDARELFDDNSPNDSINLACERIRTMIQEDDRKSCCLVITKLDLLPVYDEQREAIMKIAEDFQTTDGEARRLTVRWLKEHRDPDKDNLRRYLLSDDSRVHRVFFVWTEGLPKMQGIRSYPIGSFEPERGDIGSEVTVQAADGYDFTKATRLSFNGSEAQFRAESDKVIKTKVPAGATTGYIEIEGAFRTEGGKDDGTSERYFVVNSSASRRYEPPQSYGLIKFLAWCIDKSPRELIEEIDINAEEAAGMGVGIEG